MSKQKYHRGNLLRLKHGHVIWSAKSNYTEKPPHIVGEDELAYFIDIRPDLIGKEVVIKGSYGDLYGTAGNGGGYGVVFLESGSEIAWVNDKELEFIDEGGEHLFEQIKKNKVQYRLNQCVTIESYPKETFEDGFLHLFSAKTNKPLELGSVYLGFTDIESDKHNSYYAVSNNNGEYIIAPLQLNIKEKPKYLKKVVRGE